MVPGFGNSGGAMGFDTEPDLHLIGHIEKWVPLGDGTSDDWSAPPTLFLILRPSLRSTYFGWPELSDWVIL